MRSPIKEIRTRNVINTATALKIIIETILGQVGFLIYATNNTATLFYYRKGLIMAHTMRQGCATFFVYFFLLIAFGQIWKSSPREEQTLLWFEIAKIQLKISRNCGNA